MIFGLLIAVILIILSVDNRLQTIDPNWITVIVASAAFLTAVINLWFNSLKGPDIRLIGEPRFQINQIPSDQFKITIPKKFTLSEERLIFINTGY